MEQQSFLFLKWIRHILDCFLSLVYDEEACCPICGREVYKFGLCKKCLKDVHIYKDSFYVRRDKTSTTYYPNNENPLDVGTFNDLEEKFKAFSCTYYYGSIKELIIKLKFRGDFACAKPLAFFLSHVINLNSIDFDCITYVPSSFKNYKRRGFNQMKVIASSLGEIIDVPVYNCLRKRIGTRDQIGLSKEDRWSNMSSCFCKNGHNKAEGKRILLIDDVLTTGATVYYCAKELKKMGAKEIIILTVSKRGL